MDDECVKEYMEFIEFLERVGVDYVELGNDVGFIVPNDFGGFGNFKCLRIAWKGMVRIAVVMKND